MIETFLSINRYIQKIKGDKIIWMIYMLLIAISLLSISSSTSNLILRGDETRLDVIKTQVGIIVFGMLVTYVSYVFPIVWIFKISKYGFIISLLLLIFLALHIRLGNIIYATSINNSKRIIYFFGLQLNVFEIAKLAMVMYMAWAIDSIKNKKDKLIKFLYLIYPKKWLFSRYIQNLVYLYIPLGTIFILSLGGSMFAALFIAFLCILMIVISKLADRVLIVAIIGLIALLAIGVTVHYASNGRAFSHISSAINRLNMNYTEQIEQAEGTANFHNVLDKVRQPISAKIAIKEGGLTGKGPGNSTQKYIVPIIYEDYMFAFIVEEYGWIGAIIIMALYFSILARSMFISAHCITVVSKMASIGLCSLITWQALFHIGVNVGLLPLTGQTLPLVSHGKFSFIIFCIVFGILLNISKQAKNNLENLR